MTKAEMKVELERAYRALRGLGGKALKGELPDRTMLAYHSPSIAAAIRFVDTGELEGSEYFIGKHFSVLHETLAKA
jgi:hypothetical protein